MNNLKTQLHDRWAGYVSNLPYTPLFVTVSGAHLYGFDSPDSDIDLRGCHQLSTEKIVGLNMPVETYEVEEIDQGIEVDLVSHEIGKYFRLLCKNNGYILEQVFSQLVVAGEEFLNRLRVIARGCITRNHYYHYRGFYNSQRKIIDKQDTVTAKSVLYAYRVLLTGINLMQTGVVEANLIKLNKKFQLEGINELVASKIKEKAPLDSDWLLHQESLENLEKRLESAFNKSNLRMNPITDPVNDLLIELRMKSIKR